MQRADEGDADDGSAREVLSDRRVAGAGAEVRCVGRAASVGRWPRSQSADPIAEAFWTLADERGGPPPTTVPVSGFDDLLVAIRAGPAVDTVPAAIARGLPFGDVVTREVDGLRPTGVALCRSANGANPLADAFATAVLAAAKGAG